MICENKIKTWHDHWNDIIRYVFFSDERFMELMAIPLANKENLAAFIQRYFIEDVMTDAIVVDEDVRIIYRHAEGVDIAHPYMRGKYLEFDIYVKSKPQIMYPNPDDQLQRRDKLLFERIKWLLTNQRCVQQMKFRTIDDYQLASKAQGYMRYHCVFRYNKTY